MNVTLDEIVEHQHRFRQEIVERECVIAALEVLRTHMASGRASRSIDLGSLVSALLPSATEAVRPERPALPAPSVPALPPVPPPPPIEWYIHPELEVLRKRHGANGLQVRWAIQRMADDYTLRDIEALLRQEGVILSPAEISVVLTRLKQRGDVEEIRPGQGRTPAIFRQPATAGAAE